MPAITPTETQWLLGFSEAYFTYFTGGIMELCRAFSMVLVRWSKYLGIAAAKLNIKLWLSLVAQVAWWVKIKLPDRCFYADISGFKISSFDQTTSCLLTKGYISMESNWRFVWIWFWQWCSCTHTDIDLSTSAALQNRVLKPTYTYTVFQTVDL